MFTVGFHYDIHNFRKLSLEMNKAIACLMFSATLKLSVKLPHALVKLISVCINAYSIKILHNRAQFHTTVNVKCRNVGTLI